MSASALRSAAGYSRAADNSCPQVTRPSSRPTTAAPRCANSSTSIPGGRPDHPAPDSHLLRLGYPRRTRSTIPCEIDHREAKTTRTLSQEQRLVWLKELLHGDADTLPYRIARNLLLLRYAQPLVRIAALPTTAIVVTPHELRIALGREPAPLPEPFADMIRQHLNNRPNLRTAGGSGGNPWLWLSRPANT